MSFQKCFLQVSEQKKNEIPFVSIVQQQFQGWISQDHDT